MITLPLHNSNRTMQLLNKTCLKGVPGLYEQDGKGDDAIVYLKFFVDGWTWYLTEFDPSSGDAFGKVFSPMEPTGEYGYFNLLELSQLHGSIGQGVDRDRFFTKTRIGDLKG